MPNMRKSELEKSSFLCYTDAPNVNVGGSISVYNFKDDGGNPSVLSDGGFTYNELKNGGFGYLHLIADSDPNSVVETYIPLQRFGRITENDTVSYNAAFIAGDGLTYNFTSSEPDEIMKQNLD